VRRPRTRTTALVSAALAALLAACAGPPAAAPAAPDPADWDAVLAQARGQTVDWYAYGGDEAYNGFIDSYVAPELARLGVTLNRVPVADTADAVNKVLAEQQAGRTADGSVDAIWINGENFATGKQAGLWFCGYPEALPNARFVDFTDPAVARDFGTPVEGCEAAWTRSSSALVYDSARLGPADVASLGALEAWARANPGQFTHPAPPDFTGSMVVRTFLYDTAGGPGPLAGAFDEAAFAPLAERLFTRLQALEPALWRAGATYPTSQEATEQLYATGEIAAYFTYGPGTVAAKVADGVFPATTRQAVPDIGNIGNVANVAIPANSPDKAGALVLANLLQDPAAQLRLYADGGVHPVLALDRLPAEQQQAFAAVPTDPAVLTLEQLTADVQPELDAAYVTAVDDGWTARVLQQ
jgi:putative spermidine/putrescine transport system substrate-binding protein